jgi:S1-C subfamily serine protease
VVYRGWYIVEIINSVVVGSKMSRMVILYLAFFLLVAGEALSQDKLGQFEDQLNSREANRRKISAMVESATVWVLAQDQDGDFSTGSGFIVAPGYVITNAHVIWEVPGNGMVFIINEKLPLTEVHLVNAIMDDPQDNGIGGRDLALLRFKVPEGVSLPTLTFNLEVAKMDRVGAWGYPGVIIGLQMSARKLISGQDIKTIRPAPVVYTEGTVSTFIESNLGRSLFHTASISGGNSGGPLINSGGEVVGINTWTYYNNKLGVYWNMAQTASEIVGFLKNNGLQVSLASGQVFVANNTPRPEPLIRRPGQKLVQPKAPELSPPNEYDRYRELESFLVMVPEGWAVESEEEDSIFMSSVDSESLVYLGVFPTEGLSTEEIAKICAEELEEGTDPVKSEDSDDVYISYGKIGQANTLLVVSGDQPNKKFAVIMLAGDFDNPDLNLILNSIIDK